MLLYSWLFAFCTWILQKPTNLKKHCLISVFVLFIYLCCLHDFKQGRQDFKQANPSYGSDGEARLLVALPFTQGADGMTLRSGISPVLFDMLFWKYTWKRVSGKRSCDQNGSSSVWKLDIVEVWTLTSESMTMTSWSILFSVFWYWLIDLSFQVFLDIILSQVLQN